MRLDQPDTREPLPSVLTVAHVVYALHTLAIIVGILGAATVIGSFVGSVPSFVAVIQIRTFWFALLWALIGWVLVFTLLGAVVGVPILIGLTLWLIYRIGRGWLRLGARHPMYTH